MNTKNKSYQCEGDTNPQYTPDTTLYIMVRGGEQLELFPAIQPGPKLTKPDMSLPYRLRIKETRQAQARRRQLVRKTKRLVLENSNVIAFPQVRKVQS